VNIELWSKPWSKVAVGLAVAIVWSCAVVGCDGGSGSGDPRSPINPEEVPETKRIRRLTADQFFASLEVVTGQRWDDEEQFAATLGRPDFAEVTAEGREMSVGFAKLASDAAHQTCRRAIDEDRNTTDQASRVILRRIGDVGQLDPFGAEVNENLKYLLLRFHGVYATEDSDRRLEPWLRILQEGLTETDEARFDEGQDRWIGVCTGMVLHPDFLTY
jgi:hypothetical protein